MHPYVTGWLLGVSVLAFLVNGWDKAMARSGRRRVAESTLLALAALGGLIGSWVAMTLFRHKTRKASFLWKITLITVLWAAGVGWWLWKR